VNALVCTSARVNLGFPTNFRGPILAVAIFEPEHYHSLMSATAEALLEQFRRLPGPEQQELLQRSRRLAAVSSDRAEKPFPTVMVSGGTITSGQVAEALDDE
jgi:hypothetical protein